MAQEPWHCDCVMRFGTRLITAGIQSAASTSECRHHKTCELLFADNWGDTAYTKAWCVPECGFALINESMLHVIKQLQGLCSGAIPPGAGPPLFPARCQLLAQKPDDILLQSEYVGTHSVL